MKAAVIAASREKKLALIRAHPDLACAERNLTAESTSEQKGAGLKECSPEEFAEFQKLNAEYKKKFGFPFIIAVKGLNRTDILKAFRQRINNSADAEFDAALEQIHRIAWFRLSALS
jgi:OHCU decarboxylase